MDDFYTKAEVAQILRVSLRQINNYFSEGRLTRVQFGKKAYAPKREVDELYSSIGRGPAINQKTVETLLTRVEVLEKEIHVFKLSLGYGNQKKVRTETELLLLRQQMLDALTKKEWTPQQLMKTAKELGGTRPEEVEALIRSLGVTAWVPLVDLGRRMLSYVERHPEYPKDGLDVIADKLSASLNRFLGLVYSSTRVDGLVDARLAGPILEALEVPPNAIEEHIAAYLLR